MAKPQRRKLNQPLYHEPEAVTYAREQAGLTQRELASLIGISEQLMCDIEAGRRSLTPKNLNLAAEVLKCPRVVLRSKHPVIVPTQRAAEEDVA